MNPLAKSVLIPTLSAVGGGLVVVSALALTPNVKPDVPDASRANQNRDAIYDDILNRQDDMQNRFDDFFNDDFFIQRDPFVEMKKGITARTGTDHALGNPFDSWFSDKFAGGTINDISKREDEQFVYYDIKIPDLNSTSINTKVTDGYITVSGSTEKRTESPSGSASQASTESVFRSTFNRVFPLPDQVDQNKMEMLSEKNKVVLKFPKIRS
jgi:HSP20 family molecular chaperone IbpA